jgi:hypothetical protein
MKACEGDALLCQLVKAWRLDLTTIGPDVAETEIIGHDDEEVGLFAHGRNCKKQVTVQIFGPLRVGMSSLLRCRVAIIIVILDFLDA